MNEKKENKNKIKLSKEACDTIINDAVKQYKEGKITNSLDVENYLDSLLQPLMQKLLDAELENHLEYSKYEHKKEQTNSRNGHCKEKNVKTKYGNIKVQTPRDRESTFEPIIIEKGQTRLTGFEDKCIALYAKGMSVRDIEKTLKEIYGVKINKDDITKLISVVSRETEIWRRRKLKPLYVFPKTQSQRCVVHLVRNIYSLCPKKQAKEIIADYKKIYTSTSLEDANIHLEMFKSKYEKEQKRIVKKAEDFMEYLEPLFELPQEIRKCIYTSNAVESVNSALRKVTRGKGSFPNEASVYKVLYLRIKELSEKWKKPIQNWSKIQPQLIELFGERYTKYLEI